MKTKQSVDIDKNFQRWMCFDINLEELQDDIAKNGINTVKEVLINDFKNFIQKEIKEK